MNLLGAQERDFQEALANGAVTACVIGLGYVGLPLSVILAERGFHVIGVDRSEEVLDACSKGTPKLREPGLADRLAQVVEPGLLEFSTDSALSVQRADVIFVTVGTPITETRKIDLSGVRSASEAMAKGLSKGKLVVFKSTIAIGGTRDVVKPILERVSGLRAEDDFGLAFVPERTVEGKALEELPRLPKIVGGLGERSRRAAAMVYAEVGGPLVPVSCLEVAETAKLFDNIYRDVNIALANELALCCEAAGVDAVETIRAANESYERTNLLMPGPGVGGSCLTKDSYIFSQSFSHNGLFPRLVLEARQLNDQMPQHLAELAEDAFREMEAPIRGARVAVLGYAMKSETDDTRGTPVRPLVEWLRDRGADVTVYDPHVPSSVIERETGATAVGSLESAVNGCSAICLVTDHLAFRGIEPAALGKATATPCALVDARHVFDPAEVLRAGFVYRGVGRPVDFFRSKPL